jgi:hypothetical protein
MLQHRFLISKLSAAPQQWAGPSLFVGDGIIGESPGIGHPGKKTEMT